MPKLFWPRFFTACQTVVRCFNLHEGKRNKRIKNLCDFITRLAVATPWSKELHKDRLPGRLFLIGQGLDWPN